MEGRGFIYGACRYLECQLSITWRVSPRNIRKIAFHLDLNVRFGLKLQKKYLCIFTENFHETVFLK
jgi:hypothetical protein